SYALCVKMRWKSRRGRFDIHAALSLGSRRRGVQRPTWSCLMSFADRVAGYRDRVERALDARLPPADTLPASLHAAMRYAALGGGKRIRPLLCYASGEVLGIPADRLDDAACAVECVHVFSLVHDDLPAMDDDA